MRTITINKSTPDRAGYVSYALAAAFHDDPVFAWCVPDEERRRAMLPRFFNLVSRTLSVYDEIYEADDAVGAALWVPPGEASIPFGEEERFGAELEELLGPDAERMFEIVGLLDAQHPHDDVHYLWFLGVVPTRQGEGIGTALMDPVLRRSDRDGRPAYLDATSEHSKRLYERTGFVVGGELAPAGGPTLWQMWRQPGAAS